MKKRILNVFNIVLIGIILEILLFNINSYLSFFRGGEKISYEIGEVYEFLYTDKENEIIIPIDNINTEISTIKLNVSNNGNLKDTFEYRIAYSDEASSELRWMQNSKEFTKDNKNTQYISCFLSGKVNTIWILTDKETVENGYINSVEINEKIPVDFNFTRCVSVILIMIFIYVINKVEQVYDYKNIKQEIILFSIVIFMVLLSSMINSLANNNELDFYSEDFLNAIKSGQVHLLRDDSEKLSSLENPYDTLERASKLERDEEFLWDVAYYNEKYYVYFGIVPMLTLFLPYNLITKTYLTSNVAVLIYSILAIILLKEILLKLINKYYKNISFKVVVYLVSIITFGSILLFINGVPRFYEVSISSGLTFSLLGIYAILTGIEDEKVKYKYIFWGSLSLALAVGCRPTFLLVSLIVLPLFIKILINAIKNKEKKEIIKILLNVGIPYIVIGIALMYYNYIRFDSILEFGAKYQLTINNMGKLGSRFFTIPYGLWCNFFSLPHFPGGFPFLGNHNNMNFNGYYYIENMIAGVFIISPICFINFYIMKAFKKEEEKELKYLTTILLIIGLLIATISVSMGGSNQRYAIDYAWILNFSGALIYLSIYSNLKSNESKKIMEKIIGIIAVFTVIINIAAGIISEGSAVKTYSPKEYNNIKYSICFWE